MPIAGGGLTLCEVPNDAMAGRLALTFLAQHPGVMCGAVDAEAFVDRLGWRFRYRSLGCSTGLRALLAPLTTGGFSVVVNADRHPDRYETLWLVVHEVAHSFFYTAGKPPQRIIPGSDGEERFCDSFADAFVTACAETRLDLTLNAQQDVLSG